jgi:hypothetical protein
MKWHQGKELNNRDLTVLMAAVLALMLFTVLGAGLDIADLKTRVSILEAECGSKR